MAYDVQISLPEEWRCSVESYKDEDGSEVTHLEARLGKDIGDGTIEAYVGDMPEGDSAADQAITNYADMVGFDGDEDFNPIEEWEFNGKKAYGFEALCEDDSPMRVLCVEIKQGILAIICVAAPDEAKLDEVFSLAARLRIRK